MNFLVVIRDKKIFIPSLLKEYKNKKIVLKEKIKKEDVKKADLIITIGGDGTFLSASHFSDNTPILGINRNPSESECFLCNKKLENFERVFKKILNKEYKIKDYTRVDVRIKKEKKEFVLEKALNETFFGNINPHHTSKYEILYRNKKDIQKSSGVIITTGAGSTAWYKSLGEKSFSPLKKELRFVVRELYKGRLQKPNIKKGKIKEKEKLILVSKMNHGIISIDSIRTYKVGYNDKVILKVGIPLKVVFV
ncbi:MAG: NAD(+)/NADH kinase [Candidatus Pacearchaeota archaeon]